MRQLGLRRRSMRFLSGVHILSTIVVSHRWRRTDMIPRASRSFAADEADTALISSAMDAMRLPLSERTAVESRMHSLYLPMLRHLLGQLRDHRTQRQGPLLVGVSAPQVKPPS